jgi:hypothetical protein
MGYGDCPMIKFKKAKLPIDWYGGKEEVDAYVSGNLMVHKTISNEPKHFWVITHVGTGLSIGSSYPPFRTMKEAKACVADLLAEDDWSGDDADKLYDILCRVFTKHTGVFWESDDVVYEKVIPNEPLPQSKCVKCGERSERLLLSNFNNMTGWLSWCLKCNPYPTDIIKEEGKLTRW